MHREGSRIADRVATTDIRCLVIYRPGPAWLKGRPLSAQPLKEHRRYMLGLYLKDVLELNGPLGSDADAVLLKVPDRSAAETIARADPAVTSGVFTYAIHDWHVVAWERHLRKQ